jgi:DNA end-binding protein Ku
MSDPQNDGEDVVAGRALWKGFIHFGDTSVPVKLHTAVKESRLQFHLLHKRDRVRLQQQMICAYEKVPVPPEEQVRGFEVEEGKYILVDPAELEEIEPEATREILVHEFVKTAQIDPILMERTYYLEPDMSFKGYNALVELLQEMEINGICTWTMRKRSYFGALQAGGKTLRLKTLRYADEVMPVASLNLQKFSVSEKELNVGSELINHLTVPFQPEKFINEHQQKLQDLIDKKARGEKIVLLPPKPMKSTEPNKLLEALEASLKKVA